MAVKYTKEHEWIKIEGGVGTVGITEYAQEQLGDIVFVDLPQVGKKVAQGDEAAVVESVKAASEIYAPAGGEVTEVNRALAEEPGKVNSDAMGSGWIFKIKIVNQNELDSLMDRNKYDSYLAGLK